MNKLLKGSIAGAAGIALLLGGAGTLASWNDSAAVAGGTIVAGNLRVTTTAGTWAVKRGAATAVTVPDITQFKAVPGDVLTYTSSAAVVATGNNLVATLAISPASIAATTPGKAADDALAGILAKTATLTATGTGITAGSVAGTFTVTAGAAGVSVPVTSTVSLTFPNGGAGAENDAKLGSVNLANLAVTLTQN